MASKTTPTVRNLSIFLQRNTVSVVDGELVVKGGQELAEAIAKAFPDTFKTND